MKPHPAGDSIIRNPFIKNRVGYAFFHRRKGSRDIAGEASRHLSGLFERIVIRSKQQRLQSYYKLYFACYTYSALA